MLSFTCLAGSSQLSQIQKKIPWTLQRHLPNDEIEPSERIFMLLVENISESYEQYNQANGLMSSRSFSVLF